MDDEEIVEEMEKNEVEEEEEKIATPTTQTETGNNKKLISIENLNEHDTNSPSMAKFSPGFSPLNDTLMNREQFAQFFSKLLKRYTCFDFIPESGKIILIDTRLSALSVFYILEDNGIQIKKKIIKKILVSNIKKKIITLKKKDKK